MYGEKVHDLRALKALKAEGKIAIVLVHLFLDDFSEVAQEALAEFEEIILISLQVKLASAMRGEDFQDSLLHFVLWNYLTWLRLKHSDRFINLHAIGPHFHMYCSVLREHGFGYLDACDAVSMDLFESKSKNGPLIAALLCAQVVTSVEHPIAILVPNVECFEIMRTVVCWECNKVSDALTKCACERVSFCSETCRNADLLHQQRGCTQNKTMEDYDLQILKIREYNKPLEKGMTKTLGLALYERQKCLQFASSK